MKRIIIFSLLLLSMVFFILIYKKEKVILYKYHDITITRINYNTLLEEGNKIRFFYGDINDNSFSKDSYIEVTFSGFDDGMMGYIYFLDNKNVYIKDYLGSFISKGKPSKLIIDSNSYIKWDPILYKEGKCRNMIYVSNNFPTENNKNLDKTDVRTIYEKD